MDNTVEALINEMLEKQIQSLKEGIAWLENLKPRKKVKRGPYNTKAKAAKKGWSAARRKKFSAYMKKK